MSYFSQKEGREQKEKSIRYSREQVREAVEEETEWEKEEEQKKRKRMRSRVER
jgi:hypothetical protein